MSTVTMQPTEEGTLMKKPYFVRLVAADFLAQVFQIPEGQHEKWLSTLALDLFQGKGSTEYARSLIAEAEEYYRQKVENGKKGGRPKKPEV
ncbi:hypothetical protein KP005_19370 [Geomonas nitrogeniifigens]|uniref:Uncharacterized protein n=1 Tax=Geomonas diazotrophica TaxID=2843197 RepID=A0ABX8JI92_9BACT|nr:hypothetical protein [Geomonas nitrogeniifigens]QWV97468.1 hypothetical protein KP005_19370 [Geomonas nitrogeniifigens]